MDKLHTQIRPFQYRGPSTSDDYNTRIEEEYRDLTALYNMAKATGESVREFFSRILKEHTSLSRVVAELDSRLDALETEANTSSLFDPDQIENERFITTPYEIAGVSRCYLDSGHGVLTLPKVDSSSISKLTFTDPDGESRLPSTLEMRVVGVAGSADNDSSVIDTSDPKHSINRQAGRIWERNVIVDTPNLAGAQCYVYLRVPTDMFTTEKSNVIVIHPYPTFDTDIMEVAVTSKAEVFLNDNDGYTALNSSAYYSGNTAAVGKVPPGGWNGDAILKSGPKAFYFTPRTVTGIRIKLRQRNYYYEGGKYIYSYGLSMLDVRYDKFLTSGKSMVRLDPPASRTISSVTDVEPLIFNIPEASVADAFSYRVVWETAYDSGTYTTTPVPNSARAWIEVTLNQVANSAPPALSGLAITYS